MSRYKIIKIADERVYFKDKAGKVHDDCLFNIMDHHDVIHHFSLEDQARIAEESVLDGFYAAKTRTDEKILVSLMRERYLPTFVLLFMAAMITSVFMAPRLVHLDGIKVAGGFLFFPLVFACTDIINELYGYNRVKRVIYSAVGCMLVIAFLMTINLNLPGSLHGGSDAPFIYVHKDIPVILVSWAVSLLVADMLNAYIFHKLKYWMCRKALWLRSITSTFVSQIIFSPLNGTFLYIAGYFDDPITKKLSFYLQNHTMKLGYAVAVLPLIYAAVYYVRRKDAHIEIKEESLQK